MQVQHQHHSELVAGHKQLTTYLAQVSAGVSVSLWVSQGAYHALHTNPIMGG